MWLNQRLRFQLITQVEAIRAEWKIISKEIWTRMKMADRREDFSSKQLKLKVFPHINYYSRLELEFTIKQCCVKEPEMSLISTALDINSSSN